jgi:hypothetical protein
MGAELVGQRDPVDHQVLAGSHHRPQRHRRCGVRHQRPQPRSVGAQRVREDERVEPVILVARRAVAAAQVLDLIRADHHHGEPRVDQDIHHLPVGPLNRDLCHPGTSEAPDELSQTGGRVDHGKPLNLTASGVDHRDGVVVLGPVHSCGQAGCAHRRKQRD